MTIILTDPDGIVQEEQVPEEWINNPGFADVEEHNGGNPQTCFGNAEEEGECASVEIFTITQQHT